jgi:hypothetical protein
LQFAISVIGVLVFLGLTAYDTQRIKADYIEYSYAEGTEEAGKRSVMDALGLYLNFINLFQCSCRSLACGRAATDLGAAANGSRASGATPRPFFLGRGVAKRPPRQITW